MFGCFSKACAELLILILDEAGGNPSNRFFSADYFCGSYSNLVTVL